MEYLVDNNVSVLVSLDGPEEMNDRYRKTKGGTGTFRNVMKNIERLRKMNSEYFKKKLGFSIVLAPPYDIKSVLKFFEENDFLLNRVILPSFVDEDDTNFFERFTNMEQIDYDLGCQLAELKSAYIKMLLEEERNAPGYQFMSNLFEDRIRDIYKRCLVRLQGQVFPNGICLPGVQKLLISPDGKFHICEKIGHLFPIGDLYNGFDIDKIYRLIYEYISISESDCINCWAVRFCKACFIRAIKGEHMSLERKRRHCEEIKVSIISGLKAFCELMSKKPNVLEFMKEERSQPIIDLVFRFIKERRDANIYNHTA